MIDTQTDGRQIDWNNSKNSGKNGKKIKNEKENNKKNLTSWYLKNSICKWVQLCITMTNREKGPRKEGSEKRGQKRESPQQRGVWRDRQEERCWKKEVRSAGQEQRGQKCRGPCHILNASCHKACAAARGFCPNADARQSVTFACRGARRQSALAISQYV